jgi:hypothetical protein
MYPQGMVGCTGSRMMGAGPASQPRANHDWCEMQCNSHPTHTCLHQLNYTSHPMWVLHTTCYIVHTRHTSIHTKFNSHPISVLHTTCYVIHTQYTPFHTNYNSHIMLVLNTQTYIHLQISHQNPHNSHRNNHLHPTMVLGSSGKDDGRWIQTSECQPVSRVV